MKQEIKKILDGFGIEYRDFGNRLTGRCPIHSGDNKTAFSIYTENGAWRCFTGGCHEKNGGLLGLVRLLLKKAGKPCSFEDAKTIVGDISKLDYNETNYRFLLKEVKDSYQVLRSRVLPKLNIPSKYFIEERGFSKEVLVKYDVGNCFNKDSKMFNRAVVPIYDVNHQYMVGCTGRSIDGSEPKWLHDRFKRDNSLYNSWFAKHEIKRTNTCVLVESPGNIWRLEEAGVHCGLGIYGTELSFGQMRILANLGVLNIVLALDNDDAGKKATARLVERLKGLYNIVIPKIDYGDLAECPKNYLNQIITSHLQELSD